MAKKLTITVKESLQELKSILVTQTPSKQKRINMLILIKRGNHETKESLMHSLGVCSQSVQNWRTNYIKGGIDLLLSDERKTGRKAAITSGVKLKLNKRLSNPKAAFNSFNDVQKWLETECGIQMKYQAVHKYLKRNFGVKLKVARKSHINKSPADEAVFKKPSRTTSIY
jgi:transposase